MRNRQAIDELLPAPDAAVTIYNHFVPKFVWMFDDFEDNSIKKLYLENKMKESC